ncbi:hypothetical protein GCM10011487_66220 [Steroidobacter agaridevorans]|uniref:Uncharacterized protein n=1 Tax=Steroidobacter agaridevorans TaxID=2695856 RepID=A0A829YP53_9GAMM|nr:hypothetical protein GCM10011487_66220 [Steroidobacter agaridevorans]
MAGVGDQGERPRQQSASKFDQHERCGQREGDTQDLAAGASAVVVIMVVAVAVIVRMAMAMAMLVPVLVHGISISRLILCGQTSYLPGL